MKPVLLVTGHAPPDRAPAFAALHEAEGIELALFGGRSKHGGVPGPAAAAPPGTLPGVGGTAYPVPHRFVAQRSIHALAASGRFRAVVAGLGGRVALPAAYVGSRFAGVPFVLWASLWAHPRSVAHAASAVPTRLLYAHADAIVTYGPHVSAHVARQGARNVEIAPQAVDGAFWSAPVAEPRRLAPFQAAFVGRDAPEKGLGVLLGAWRRALLRDAALVVVGADDVAGGGRSVHPVGVRAPEEVRNFLAGSDVLVVPSVRTATFREPWGLVVNEAMHRALPAIASTEVGAGAGGLVRHEVNGLVVPAGDERALAAALARLRDDPPLRARLGEQARRDVASYTPSAWAAGVSAALRDVGASRRPH